MEQLQLGNSGVHICGGNWLIFTVPFQNIYQKPLRKMKPRRQIDNAMDRINVLGLPLDALDMPTSVERCHALIESRGHQHVVLNASKAVMAETDPALRDIISSCSLINADGQSIVWAARFLGKPVPERVAGIDLMDELVAASVTTGHTVYLLGAHELVVKQVRDSLISRGVHVVGYRNGYWDSSEEAQVVDSIAETRPDILFVAMPSPRKEFFLAKYLHRLDVGLAFGVGGSFDIIAGKTKRAPLWMQRIGCEWLYRLLQEPRRMLKRYVVGNLKFIRLVGRHWLRESRSGR